MNRKIIGQLVLALSLLSLIGCSSPTRSIILMPDSDGHVGQAEVSTSGGKLLLQTAGDMTQVAKAGKPPSGAVKADPAYIARTFGEALAVEPAPSAKFTLLFQSGTTTMTADSIKDIENIVAASQQRKAIHISIRGHTDSVGSDKFNNKLAIERAERVRTLLLKRGIHPGLIAVSSHGKSDPAVPTPDGVAEPRNRRVDVIIQ